MGFKRSSKHGKVYNDDKKSHGSKSNSPNNDDGSNDHQREEIDPRIAKEEHDKILDHEYDRFLQGMNDFGSGDIATAIDLADQIGMNGNELSDLVREWAEETETPIADVDINYILYDHILQNARNEIDQVIGFDFMNDTDESGMFEVHGNYMASSFDYSTEAQEELQGKINSASSDDKRRLKENKFTKLFFEYVDIEV